MTTGLVADLARMGVCLCIIQLPRAGCRLPPVAKARM